MHVVDSLFQMSESAANCGETGTSMSGGASSSSPSSSAGMMVAGGACR